MLCYAINQQTSYQSLEDWLNIIDSDTNARRLPIALIGTKSDLHDDRKVTKNQGHSMKRTITQEAQTNPVPSNLWGNADRCFLFQETSAYEDWGGIKTVFTDLGRTIAANKWYYDGDDN